MSCSPFLYDEENDSEDQENNDGQKHPQNNCNNVCCRELKLKMRDNQNTEKSQGTQICDCNGTGLIIILGSKVSCYDHSVYQTIDLFYQKRAHRQQLNTEL